MNDRSPVAEWATDAPRPIIPALGVHRDPLTRRCRVPGAATIRRVLAWVDGHGGVIGVPAHLLRRLG